MLRRLFAALMLALVVRAWGAEPVLILISLDGFRWDYLEKYAAEAPRLRALAAAGVRAERMISCFPTQTFPNHYSIATGLLPEHHGIVANRFYDPVLKAAFAYKLHACAVDARWWGVEPIWITVVRRGWRSACLFWPGSEAAIGGLHPTYWRTFDGRLTSAQRVDGLLAWLDLPPEQRPVFCTLYLDTVDHAGHDFGPDAPQTAAAVRNVDGAVGRLVDGLAGRGRAANLVIVSDHGMAAVPDGHTVFLDDLVDLATVQIDCTGTHAGLRPREGSAPALADRLRRSAPPTVRVLLREDLPGRFHYRDNPRIPPVLVLADEGWQITTRAEQAARAKPERGDHGYDNLADSMGATFIAEGPAFRSGAVIPPFANIEVYDLLCEVLGVKPAPNDGRGNLGDLVLRRPASE